MECLKVSVKMVSNAEDGRESLTEKDLAFSQWPSLGSPVNRFDQHVGCEASTMSSTSKSCNRYDVGSQANLPPPWSSL